MTFPAPVFGPRRLFPCLAFALLCVCGAPPAAAGGGMSSAEILQELQGFRELGGVLYIAAHPDDENTRLIAWLACGRGCRTGYLSLTRGDGGQNLLGPELGDELGVIRTQELLAARRIDGGRQFFTRARDFGFSKDAQDSLARWNRPQVLADIVRIIRTFRPDVIITRFSPVPGGTHGHHTAATILALEAFKLAGDPAAYPEQLGELTPWQPKRILWNSWPAGRDGTPAPDRAPPTLRLDVGGYQPLLGESFGEIAARSRSMHKSQGFGSTDSRGAASETFQLLAGEPATKDLFDGIDTTWNRFPGGGEIDRMAGEILARFNPQDPSASVPALLILRRELAALPADPVVTEKRGKLDRILQGCLGLYVETVTVQPEVVPGETMRLRHTVIVRAGFPVRWLAVHYPSGPAGPENAIDLPPNQLVSRETTPLLPVGTPVSQPYWLRAPGTEGMFRVDDPGLIGLPENPPVFPVEQVFDVGGQKLIVADEPVQFTTDPVKGEIRRRLAVIPPATIEFRETLQLFAPGATQPVFVQVASNRADLDGILRLTIPAGWQVSPEAQPFHLTAAGDTAQLTFTVTAPAGSGMAEISAEAESAGTRYSSRRVDIRYDHIPPLLLQPPARLKVVSLELAIRGHAVGYLPGAGDLLPACLARMGYAVTPLSGADLTPDRLRGFDAIVVGIRAFNTHPDYAAQLPALFAYVQAGGNVVVQYNTPNDLKPKQPAPYALKLSNDRVTNARAPVLLLAPDHPALLTPNRIGPADFDGWVQERGRNFSSEWDARFIPLLSCHDDGEPPKDGGLLVAHYGRGYFVYTGLSWFRELPEGVPGAYRLFANLLSLGK